MAAAPRHSVVTLIAVLAVAVALPAAPAAGARLPTLIDEQGHRIHGKRLDWVRQSRMPIVSGRVRIVSASCPGRPRFAGCVFSRRPRTLYLRPGALTPKGVLYHELGHTFDLTLLRHRDRRAFKRIAGLGGRGWFTGSGPPAELFAEGYALCSRFGVRRPAADKLDFTRSVYGYRPTSRQHRSVCRLILRAGAPKRQKARPKPQRPADTPPVIEQKPPEPPAGEQPSGSPPSSSPPLLPIRLPRLP